MNPLPPSPPTPLNRTYTNLAFLQKLAHTRRSDENRFLLFNSKSLCFETTHLRDKASAVSFLCQKISELYEVISQRGTFQEKQQLDGIVSAMNHRFANYRIVRLASFSNRVQSLLTRWNERMKSFAIEQRFAIFEMNAPIYSHADISVPDIASLCQKAVLSTLLTQHSFLITHRLLANLPREIMESRSFLWQLTEKEREVDVIQTLFKNFNEEDLLNLENLKIMIRDLFHLYHRYLWDSEKESTNLFSQENFEQMTAFSSEVENALAEKRKKIGELASEMENILSSTFHTRNSNDPTGFEKQLSNQTNKIKAIALLKRAGDLLISLKRSRSERSFGFFIIRFTTNNLFSSDTIALTLIADKISKLAKIGNLSLPDIQNMRAELEQMNTLHLIHTLMQMTHLKTKNFLIETLFSSAKFPPLSDQAGRLPDLTLIDVVQEISRSRQKMTLKTLTYCLTLQNYSLDLIRAYETVTEKERLSIEKMMDDPRRSLSEKITQLEEYREVLLQRLAHLTRAVGNRSREEPPPQQYINDYLDRGICFGATLFCAENRLNNSLSPIRPNPTARFLQANHSLYCLQQTLKQVPKLQDKSPPLLPEELRQKELPPENCDLTVFPLSTTILKKRKLKTERVDLKRYFGKKDLTVGDFINGLDQFEDQWKGSRSFLLIQHQNVQNFEMAEAIGEDIQSAHHAVYFGLYPYEISDVNYPGSLDFATFSKDTFKLLALGYFATNLTLKISHLIAISRTTATERVLDQRK